MLQYRSHDPADENHDKQPHQALRKPRAKAESRMEEDQWKTQETQPEVAAHPGLCPADAPDWHLLPCPQQSRKEHKCGGDAPINQPEDGTAAGTLRRATAVGNVHHGGDDQSCQTADEPLPMCLINAQWSLSCFHYSALLTLFAYIRSAYFLSLEQAAEKFQRVYAMRRIVRASIHATWFLMAQAEIARSSFHLHAGDCSSRIRQVFQLDREGMHIDISVRTIVCALATTNAPVLDDHLERIAAANRSDRTAHHAQRIAALPARCSDQIPVEA